LITCVKTGFIFLDENGICGVCDLFWETDRWVARGVPTAKFPHAAAHQAHAHVAAVELEPSPHSSHYQRVPQLVLQRVSPSFKQHIEAWYPDLKGEIPETLIEL
jgi:hypothetical protein